MEFIITIILTFFILTCIYFLYNNKKKILKRKIETVDIKEGSTLLAVRDDNFELLPQIEQLPSDTVYDENVLHEITDKNILIRLNGLLPQLANIAGDKIKENIVNRAVHNINNMELYQVLIPNGAVLDKSKEVVGAVRANFRDGGGRIAGQANLVKVKPNQIAQVQKTAEMTNIVANAMNVGAMVVGQYYMTEINDKLEQMQGGIDKISEFQERQFKARILALIVKIGKIAKFNMEIIENDEIRKRSLDNLSRHEDEAIELLQQVNLSIDDLISKNQNNDYNNYEKNIGEFEKLTQYQQYLLSILEEIGRLNYFLNKGTSSSEMCYSVFEMYIKESNKSRENLAKWHDKQIKYLEIHLDEKKRAKQGIEGFLGGVQGLINNDWRYHKLSNVIIKRIKNQSRTIVRITNRTNDLLNKDKKIIIQNGKYYYLTE